MTPSFTSEKSAWVKRTPNENNSSGMDTSPTMSIAKYRGAHTSIFSTLTSKPAMDAAITGSFHNIKMRALGLIIQVPNE
tara:strand:+ start:13491 stop:13727 length:237 start_codon:yes stop_codon:yes gene_type:complete